MLIGCYATLERTIAVYATIVIVLIALADHLVDQSFTSDAIYGRNFLKIYGRQLGVARAAASVLNPQSLHIARH